MNRRLLFLATFLPVFAAQPLPAQAPKTDEPTSENNEQLREGLKRFPEADANKDGILTLTEARAFLAKHKPEADKAKPKPKPGGLKPDMANVPYGPHERNVLDFWKAKSDKPAPLVVFIHGGGFRGGSKESYHSDRLLASMLKSGVNCAAINYRFLDTAPVQTILLDCAHAVQFLRSKAADWNIDKTHIACVGGSAGAGTSLWLATHDDVAIPGSDDPVLRESSRISCAVLYATQATYDVTRWPDFLGMPEKPFWDDNEALFFYGVKSPDDLKTPEGKKILRECDMLAWISKDDAPVFMDSNLDVPKPTDRNEWVHSTQHARAVKKALLAAGVECVLVQDEKKDAKPDVTAFLRGHLGMH